MSVWRHVSRFGAVWMTERMHSVDLMGDPLRVWITRRVPHLMLLGGPVAATFDIARLLLSTAALRPYWHMMPGFVWSKLAWYAGGAQAMRRLMEA